VRITKHGHSCLHVLVDDASLLIDPGAFSSGFEELTGLTGILVTHQHPDHLDVSRLQALLAANPDAVVVADHETAQFLEGAGIPAREVGAGTWLDLGTSIEVVGERHAVIHRDLPGLANVGYLVTGRLLHPGDALTVPAGPVEVLALPVSAPWMALKESIDYFRAVRPTVAIPIHDKVLSGTQIVYTLLQRLGPPDVRWVDLDDAPGTVEL
jgi:L-ascorbate metabolism protein UlaG (beta-lactamase superfamily)